MRASWHKLAVYNSILLLNSIGYWLPQGNCQSSAHPGAMVQRSAGIFVFVFKVVRDNEKFEMVVRDERISELATIKM
jgi:hypothetical protein